jgi:hypothetical protein
MDLGVIYRAAVETMKREIISQRAKIAALEAEVAFLRINQQAQGKICPTCMGRGEYLSDDPGTGLVKCGLCRATGKLSPVR